MNSRPTQCNQAQFLNWAFLISVEKENSRKIKYHTELIGPLRVSLSRWKKSLCPFWLSFHRFLAGAGTLTTRKWTICLQNSCRSSPYRRVRALSHRAVIRRPPIKANTTSCWGSGRVGGSAHDNVTRLEMKHPHLQTPLSLSKLNLP